MRKSLLLIAAAMVVLCFTQCTKTRPDSPHYSGKVGDMYIQHISVEASRGGNSNSKVSVENGEIDADMKLKWEDADKIYVYDGSKLCGILDFVDWTSEDHKSAKFESNPSAPIATTEGATLSFYYFGSNLTSQAGTYGGNATVNVDLSTQNGSLESIKNNLVLKNTGTVTFTSGQESYNLNMEVPYSIIKFDLSTYGTNANYGGSNYNLTVSNVAKKGFTITNGNLTEDNFAKLGSMTFQNVNGSNQYYVAMMAGDKQELQFTTTKISVNRTISLTKGSFYTDDKLIGNGVVLAKVETVAPCGIHTTVASCGGVVNNAIGVTKQGICWSTSSKPTIADNVYYHNYDYGIDITTYLSSKYTYPEISDTRWTPKNQTKDNTFTGFMSKLVPNTTYHVRAFAIFGNTVLYDEGEKTFTTLANESEYFTNDAKLVNLGLPSPYQNLRWAKIDLGATAPNGEGDFYMWGDNACASPQITSNTDPSFVQPAVNCDWKSYRFAANGYGDETEDWGKSAQLTKYCKSTDTKHWYYSTSPDGNTELDDCDDAVRQTLGGDWRMPTKDELTAALNSTNVNIEWINTKATFDKKYSSCVTEYNRWNLKASVAGILLSNKTDNSQYIFLPAVGNNYRGKREGSYEFPGNNPSGLKGYCTWSPSLKSDNENNSQRPEGPYCGNHNSGMYNIIDNRERISAECLRPVKTVTK